VLDVLGEDGFEVTAAEDDGPVEALAPQGTDLDVEERNCLIGAPLDVPAISGTVDVLFGGRHAWLRAAGPS
jgi:hypothetical protein